MTMHLPRGVTALIIGAACAGSPSGHVHAAESPFAVTTDSASRAATPVLGDERALPRLPLAMSPRKGSAEGSSSPEYDDTFHTVYHGAPVDSELREVKLTPELIERSQRQLIERIGVALGKERLEQYAKLESTLFEVDALEHLDRPKIRARVIEVWLDELAEKKIELGDEVRRWRERHAAIRLNLPDAFGLDGDRKRRLERVNRLSATATAELRRVSLRYRWVWLERVRVREFELIPFDWYFPSATTEYIEDCRDAGVPIPPDWGDHRWEYQDVLDDEFIDAGAIATVYAYRSGAPEGSCIALPRTDSGTGDAAVFGIICLGIETENACFWDKYATTADELAGDIPIEEWIGGVDFTGAAGNCSSCHAGQNPFVIHPGTALDIGSQGFPVQVNWHEPLLPPSWAGNPGPIALPSDTSYSNNTYPWWDPRAWLPGNDEPGKSCTACHALPDVAHPQLRFEGYCNAVLGRAADRTMPPESVDPAEHPAEWGSTNDGAYQVHIEALNALCN